MLVEELREQVCRANLRLVSEGLVVQTWGNASGVDREKGLMVIKPSGVPYDEMTPRDMVVVSLETGEAVEGHFRPSSDTPTHLELYRAFAEIGGVAHTHSLYATAWAQSRREIPCLGMTHANFCRGPVPCTRPLRAEEITENYEADTGRVIAERFASLEPLWTPAVLVAEHGPFTWGPTPDEAVSAAVTLEHIARLASETLRIDPAPRPIPRELQEKHFLRQHGPEVPHGQS